MRRMILRSVFTLSLLACPSQDAFSITVQTDDVPSNQSAEQAKSEAEKIIENQSQLATRYKLLEAKLFTLYDYERDSNPMRSKILKRAYQQSQEKMTAAHFQTIVNLLSQQQLKDAGQHQDVVLQELEALLALLESEDRGKRVRDEIRRHQEYLKEVERILRMQKGLRAQAENKGDAKRLGQSQKRTADRTQKLAKDIQENEEASDHEGENESESPDDQVPDSGDNKSDEDRSSDEDEKSRPESKQGDSENPDSGQNDPENDGGKPGESQPNSGKHQDSDSQGQPSDGQPGSNDSDNPQNSPPENPVRKKIQAAEQRMRAAQDKLEKANREQAVDDMKAAEAELAAARRELEEILRQLREEEVERTLAMLESRFRKMLERELRVYDNTRKLNQTPTEARNTNFEIRAGKLSVEQNSIATEADRALMLLREDGSSVAFPETVDQMHQDMLQVSARLSAAKTGRITIQLEEDILETLEFLIQALVVTQKDLEAMKQNQSKQGQGGRSGDKPLVDSLAEIKMLRGLQQRIYTRHQRYSKLLSDPEHLIGSTKDPDLQSALDRLSRRQQQLTDIARDIVVGKNR